MSTLSLTIIVVALLLFLMAFSIWLYKRLKNLYIINFRNSIKPTKIQDHEDPAHLEPIFVDKHMDLKLEDPVFNNSFEDKKGNDLEHIGSASLTNNESRNSDHSVDKEAGLGENVMQSQTELKTLQEKNV